jgi:hydroxymethylbilane synthase
MSETIHLKLGTRGSLLARTQSQQVASDIEKRHPHVAVELIIIKTSGDTIQDRPLHEFGGKGLFTKELEQALLRKEVDFAVHSFKDVPVTMPLVDTSDLVIAAIPERENPFDALISTQATRIADLPPGAKVGTGSLRRRCQILNIRPDLHIEPVRGNIDTRVKKLKAGDFDAVVLAMAGLRRAGLFDPDFMYECIDLVPASGQGALALQCRRADEKVCELLGALDDADTRTCIRAEREVVQLLQGDCHSPIAAYATIENGKLMLQTRVGARGGKLPVLAVSVSGDVKSPEVAANSAVIELQKQHVMDHLHKSHK